MYAARGIRDGRQVQDHVDVLHVLFQIGRTDVVLDEPEGNVLSQIKERAVPLGRQIIQQHHIVVIFRINAVDEPGSDMPQCAGDQDFGQNDFLLESVKIGTYLTLRAFDKHF